MKDRLTPELQAELIAQIQDEEHPLVRRQAELRLVDHYCLPYFRQNCFNFVMNEDLQDDTFTECMCQILSEIRRRKIYVREGVAYYRDAQQGEHRSGLLTSYLMTKAGTVSKMLYTRGMNDPAHQAAMQKPYDEESGEVKPSGDVEGYADVLSDPASLDASEDEAEAVRLALDEVCPDCRTLLRARYYEGLDLREVMPLLEKPRTYDGIRQLSSICRESFIALFRYFTIGTRPAIKGLCLRHKQLKPKK